MAPQSLTDPPKPEVRGSQVGWVISRIRPSWGLLDNYLMGIILPVFFSCLLNLKYMFFCICLIFF